MSSSNPSTDLSTFQFETTELRTHIDRDGVLWWMASDLCAVLDIQNTTAAIRRIEEDKSSLILIYTAFGPKEVWMVNEAGLYHLILGSRKKHLPAHQAFKHWVFHDVLPSLRRMGTYTLPGHPGVAPSHHLPPPQQPIRERAEVSEHMLAVWGFLRRAADPVSNQEIADQSRMKVGTVRKHTRYFLHLGLVDLYETFPRHLFAIPAQADKRHPAFWQRLERLAAIVEQRQQQVWR